MSKNVKISNPMKVITGVDTRWNYANVWEPKSINGGTPKYSVSLIIPKSDTKTIAKIQAAIEAAYKEGEAKLKGNGKSVPALSVLKTPLRDGDAERPDDEAYKNAYFVNANATSAPGIVSFENGVATLGDAGSATYTFSVSSAGTYDIAIRLCYPFWDKNGIYVSIDGNRTHFTESRLWWPYWRSTFWTTLASNISLSAGTHTIVISVDVKGVQFYGYRVCSSFSEAPSAGTATFTLSPRHFIDVDGNECQPDRAFKLTCEMLRRKPDSALIWYEDFRDYGVLQTNYWTTLSGSWTVWREDEYSESRVYSQLDGSGKLAWRYDGFSDIHLRARLAFPAPGSGKAGVFCGDLFCCLNYNTQAVELYNGSTLLGSYSKTIERTANADLRTNPSMYTVEMRIRVTRCVSILDLPIRCASQLRSAAFPEAMPDIGQITGRSASCFVLATHGLTSPTSALMLPSRTVQLCSMEGSAGQMPHGIRNFRCLR